MKTTEKAGLLEGDERICALGAEMLKVVAHPVRLRLVALLCDRDLPVGQLAEKLQLPQAIVSQHLRLLRMREVVAARREGSSVVYRLAQQKLRTVIKCLEECLLAKL